MPPRQLSLRFVLAACLVPTAAAHADPIALSYHVTVFQRHDFDVPLSERRWVPIDPIQFELSFTFDSDMTGQFRSSSTGQRHAVTEFGEPTFTPSFSGIPLRGAGVAGGTRGAATRVSNSVTTEFGLYQEALAVEQWVSEDAFTFATLSIQLRAELWPPLAPDAFGNLEDFLGAMRSSRVQFYFADLSATKNFDASGQALAPTFTGTSASFFGSAVPIDASPVPEPTTVLMVGAGIGCVVRRALTRGLSRPTRRS